MSSNFKNEKGKKTKKKGVLKRGNKKTKKNLKVHFKEKVGVVRYKNDEKANIKKKIETEPIIQKNNKKNKKYIQIEHKKYKKMIKNLNAKRARKKGNNDYFEEDRKDNIELHPNEIKLQERNNKAKKKQGKKVKKQRFVNENSVEDRVKKKKTKKKENSNEPFGVFSWDVIMLLGAIIAPIFVYNDMMLNI